MLNICDNIFNVYDAQTCTSFYHGYVYLIIFVDRKTHEIHEILTPRKLITIWYCIVCIHCLMIYYWCRFVLRDGQLWLGHAQAILVSKFV